MSELVKRLRRLVKSGYVPDDRRLVVMLYAECADEIERLEGENAEMKERLTKYEVAK